MVEKMSREDLEMIILENDDLYEMFDECKFLNKKYTLAELKKITSTWIYENDECE